jgi:hypothetical protein
VALAIFRVIQIAGKDTSLAEDPFIDCGFYSSGPVGAANYKNEPVHLIVIPRRSGYPGQRWVQLQAAKVHIEAVLHTETYDFFVLDGQIADFKVTGPTGAHLLDVTLSVQSASTVPGGSSWRVLNASKATQDEEEDPGLASDIWNRRGKKLARRAGSWLWNKIKEEF